MPLTDATGNPNVQVSSSVLTRIALACENANVNGHTCWPRPTRDGMDITLVGPDGSRAWVTIPYLELTDDRFPDQGIEPLISNLRMRLMMPVGIQLPFGRLM